MKIKQIILTSSLISMVAFANPWQLNLNFNTSGELLFQNTSICKFQPNYFKPGWSGGDLTRLDMKRLNNAEMYTETAAWRTDLKLSCELKADVANDKTTTLNYTLKALSDITLRVFYVGFRFPVEHLVGCPYQVDDDPPQTFPEKLEKIHLARKAVTNLRIGTKFGPMVFNFHEPTKLLLQDDRQWAECFLLRIAPVGEDDKEWKNGNAESFTVDIITPAPLTLNKPQITKLTAGDDWIPLDTVLGIKKDSILDFSNLHFTDAPAGKYGWVKAVGKHFEFEKLPGVNQRFYGINFVATGQVNPKPQSEELAERLLRIGYNTVRFHHHENDLVLHEKDSSVKLNPQTMDLFDYFFNELKKRGIYCTTDMYVSRVVLRTELWPGEEGRVGMGEFKQLLPVCKEAMDNWKAFSRNFLLHKNPYTGMTYAEDPCLAWISMVNENTPNLNLITQDDIVGKLWRKAWKAWLLEKYGSEEKMAEAWGVTLPLDLATTNLPDIARRDLCCLADKLMSDMFTEMKRFLREELGCKALLTDMNYSSTAPWAANIRSHYDYVDHHFYIDHPGFLDQPWRLPSSCPNESVVKQGGIGGTGCAFARLFDRPFTITEYNYSGPGRYRGVGGILTGCLGALQDWAGLWRFAYAHGNGGEFKPVVTNYFDMCRDPLNQCAERASLLLYLRQDMKPSQKSVAITLTRDHIAKKTGKPEGSLTPGWSGLVTHAQVGVVLDDMKGLEPDICVPLSDRAPVAGKDIVRNDAPLARANASAVFDAVKKQKWLEGDDGNITNFTADPAIRQSIGKQFTQIPLKDTMILNTPRTAGGFAPAGTTITTDSVDVTIMDTDATVWASAIDSNLEKGKHILLTHLTDLVNTEMTFAEPQRRTLLDWGKMPHLVRNGRAKVTFKKRNATNETIRAWALRLDGERLEEIPVTATADGFSINLAVDGPSGARMLYEIEVEAK
ncbi:MAG: hypothetical protein IKZ46_01035 [Victivallales bacterium]|nr:hypothetical protein [Victivallales bacterium]